jgi:hypothetical protein
VGLLNWYRDYKLAQLKMKLEAANKPYDALLGVVDKLSTAQNEQTKVLQEWMSGFKTTDIPSSTIMRDADEYQQEQDRLRSDGDITLDPGIKASITNAMKAGAFPELKDILGNDY